MFKNPIPIDATASRTAAVRAEPTVPEPVHEGFVVAPLEAPLDSPPQFVILSSDGRITSVCRASDGADDLDVIGSHFEIMFALDARHRRLPAALLERARRTGSAATDAWFLRPDGSGYRARCTLVTLRGDEGRSRGFVLALHALDDGALAGGPRSYPLLREPAPQSLFGRALLGVVYLTVTTLEGVVTTFGGPRR